MWPLSIKCRPYCCSSPDAPGQHSTSADFAQRQRERRKKRMHRPGPTYICQHRVKAGQPGGRRRRDREPALGCQDRQAQGLQRGSLASSVGPCRRGQVQRRGIGARGCSHLGGPAGLLAASICPACRACNPSDTQIPNPNCSKGFPAAPPPSLEGLPCQLNQSLSPNKPGQPVMMTARVGARTVTSIGTGSGGMGGAAAEPPAAPLSPSLAGTVEAGRGGRRCE